MAYNFAFPLRIIQFLFAIIVLALTSYVAHWYNAHTPYPSPHSINFLIFTAIFALLATIYLGLTPTYSPRAAHKFAILAVDALTCLFWFAGWVALAVFLSRLAVCTGHVCRAAKAAVVFAAFEWLLFAATTLLAALHAWRTRGTAGGAKVVTTGGEVHHGV